MSKSPTAPAAPLAAPKQPVPLFVDPGASSRALGWGAAFVLVLGSVLFLTGGRAHPGIGAVASAGGEGFFQAFAEKVRQTHDWHAMHMLILVGPLCWAVAAPALLDALRPEARALVSPARSALLLAGALWAVAFVLDGFGAPVYAAALTAAAPAADAAVLTSFAATAVMMSRLGLVSWVLGGLGITVLGGMLLERRVRTPWRIAVGASGIAIGAWPLLAALEGEYAAGPFTSRFWLANALAVGLWYIGLATCALGRTPPRAD